MNNKIAIAASFIVVAIISATLAVMASVFYLTNPLQKWQAEYSESNLPLQAEALKALRAGQQDKAVAYFEMVSTSSLIAMAERKDEGGKVAMTQRLKDSITYLCALPPSHITNQRENHLNLGEACALLSH